MKDEFGGNEPRKFVGLCPKLYGLDGELRMKGTKKSIVKQMNLEKLNQCRLQETEVVREQAQIRKRGLKNYTEKVKKIVLNFKDTKRVVLEDKTYTLAPGHWRLINGDYVDLSIPLPREGTLGRMCLDVIKK